MSNPHIVHGYQSWRDCTLQELADLMLPIRNDAPGPPFVPEPQGDNALVTDTGDYLSAGGSDILGY